MPVTHFRISSLPQYVSMLKDGNPIVLNQSYPIAEENQIVFDNQSGFKGEFLDSFSYQASSNNQDWSNEGIVNLKDLVNENTPESSNESLLINTEETVNLYNQNLIPINTSTDRIRIIAINGYGNYTINGQPLNIDDEIYMHQLPDLLFESNLGGGLNYSSVEYQCGNHLGYNEAATYTISFSISIAAKMDFIDRGTVNDTITIGGNTYPTVLTSDQLFVSKGSSGGTANIQVVIDSPFFLENAENLVRITSRSNVFEKTANETFNMNVELGESGTVDITVEHFFVDDAGTTTSSKVTLTLVDIDGDPNNVSLPNQYESLVNYN